MLGRHLLDPRLTVSLPTATTWTFSRFFASIAKSPVKQF
jgi:hypothetical protein